MSSAVNSQVNGAIHHNNSALVIRLSQTNTRYICASLGKNLRSFREESTAPRGGVKAAASSGRDISDSAPAERPEEGTNGAVGNGPVYRPRHRRDDAMPLSLYSPYRNLPTEGRTQSEGDESCNPMERSCQTPIYVWESDCKMCYGSGTITSYSGRRRGNRRASSTCPACHGLGCVRKTSSRIMPDVNGGNGQYTAGRPPSKQADDAKGKSLLERMQEKLNIQ